jgi:hypothetical protein
MKCYDIGFRVLPSVVADDRPGGVQGFRQIVNGFRKNLLFFIT